MPKKGKKKSARSVRDARKRKLEASKCKEFSQQPEEKPLTQNDELIRAECSVNQPEERPLIHRDFDLPRAECSFVQPKERPSEESISRLACRREKAKFANKMYRDFERRQEEISEQEINAMYSLQKKREANQIANMSEERLKLKREADRIKNMSQRRREKKRESGRVSNMSEERLKKKRGAEQIANLSKKGLKRKVEQVANLSEERRLKKRIKKVMCAGDITSESFRTVEKLQLGNMDTKCQYCGAVRFAAIKGRSKNSCCHQGQVKIPPLHEYPVELKELLTCEEAAQMRIHLQNPNLTLRLERLLREVNPYAHQYRMLHEMTVSGES